MDINNTDPSNPDQSLLDQIRSIINNSKILQNNLAAGLTMLGSVPTNVAVNPSINMREDAKQRRGITLVNFKELRGKLNDKEV
jgi:hypothetical protein